MTETTITPDVDSSAAEAVSTTPKKRAGGGLSGKVLAELQEIAGGFGISGASKMRKGALIDAIKDAQGGGSKPAKPEAAKTEAHKTEAPSTEAARADAPQTQSPAAAEASSDESDNRNDDGGGNQNRNQGGNRNRGD
ncbi:MAG: Rho termination factor N-terminal domain-containing protein, partial [Aeromicrobium sp.]